MELENLQDGSKKMKKCKNITFCHFFAFGGPCDVKKRVKVYKVYVSWKPWLYSLRRHQKKWFLSNWGRTRCNRSAQGLKMANCTSFKILTHIHLHFLFVFHVQYSPIQFIMHNFIFIINIWKGNILIHVQFCNCLSFYVAKLLNRENDILFTQPNSLYNLHSFI